MIQPPAPSNLLFSIVAGLVFSISITLPASAEEKNPNAPELVAVTDGNVTMRLKSGRIMTIEMSRLSPAEQEYAKAWAAEHPDATIAHEPPVIEDTLNFDDPWPDKIRFSDDLQIETVEEDREAKRFIYESANFRFNVDVRLSPTVVKGFALMFEATQLYCRTLPLGISGGEKKNGKYQVLLFETKRDYIKAGGPPSSAGVFISGPGRNVVMVPLTSLGVRPVGSGYMLDRDKANGTLVHEITHQLTPSCYFTQGPRGWFSEGIAEYVTATRYRSGSFTPRTILSDAEDYATAYGRDHQGGRSLGKEITAPPLKDFLMMSYADFAGPAANFNYGFGLILTTYFLHLDGEGDGIRMKNFLKGLHEGKTGQSAIDILLDGRSYADMEEAITKAWKRKGVEIDFTGSVQSAPNKY